MGTRHGKLIVGLSLAMLAATNAQDVARRVIPKPLPALTVPDKPPVPTGKQGKTKADEDLSVASAPLTTVTAKLFMWAKPQGTYMTELRKSILAAEAAGDFAERDRLFAIYQPWAEKYLVPEAQPDNKQSP